MYKQELESTHHFCEAERETCFSDLWHSHHSTHFHCDSSCHLTVRGNQNRFSLTRSESFPLDDRTPPKHSAATLSRSDIVCQLFVRRLTIAQDVWVSFSSCIKLYAMCSRFKIWSWFTDANQTTHCCTAMMMFFLALLLTVPPSYLQMLTSAARETEGVTTSATTLWAVTAAHVTKATCW